MKHLTLTLLLVLVLGSSKLVAQNWVNGGNTLSNLGRLGINSNYSLIFETNNTERGRVTNTGFWGFGTTTPNAKIHINSAANQSPLRVQLNGSTKFLVNGEGGVSIGTASLAPTNGLMVSGQVGIGTTDVSNYKLKVLQNGPWGLNLENSDTSDDWEIWTSGGGNLVLWANNEFRGAFDANDGSYSSISDERLKTNIKAMPTMLGKINQLKPATYQFKKGLGALQNNLVTASNNEADQSFGFMAQDVAKIFPNLVKHHVNKERNLDTYSLDYSSFGVIAIKGIQEMQQTVQDQQQKLTALEAKIAKLEAALAAVSSNPTSIINPGLIGVSLEQNQPNPFHQSTSFRYTVPTGAKAQIMIYDATSGILLKTIPAPANGHAELNGNDLKAGTYIYRLVIDGKQVDSKKMVLSK